jgi:hypothetical protein
MKADRAARRVECAERAARAQQKPRAARERRRRTATIDAPARTRLKSRARAAVALDRQRRQHARARLVWLTRLIASLCGRLAQLPRQRARARDHHHALAAAHRQRLGVLGAVR